MIDEFHRLDRKTGMNIHESEGSEPFLGRGSTRIIKGEDRDGRDVNSYHHDHLSVEARSRRKGVAVHLRTALVMSRNSLALR